MISIGAKDPSSASLTAKTIAHAPLDSSQKQDVRMILNQAGIRLTRPAPPIILAALLPGVPPERPPRPPEKDATSSGNSGAKEHSRMATAQLALPRERNITFWGAFPFFAVHLACLAAFFTDFRWTHVVLALSLYYVGMFFVTAGYHRYFSHR